MLKISDIAAEKAKEILKAEGKEGWGLRVFIHGSGCCGPSYGMDLDENPAEGDETVEKNGLKVFVDKDASASLKQQGNRLCQERTGRRVCYQRRRAALRFILRFRLQFLRISII